MHTMLKHESQWESIQYSGAAESGVCECVMSVLVSVRELWMQCGEVEVDRWVDREIKRELWKERNKCS